MFFDNLTATLVSPPLLFFMLGMLAVWMRSDLRLPDAVSKFLSLYLLLAIGLKGGVELAHSGITWDVLKVLLFSIAAATLIPIWCFFILKRRMSVQDAAATAATYGSISAVTFVTAVATLQSLEIAYSGHMVAAMALMESPAIVVGILLARRFAQPSEADAQQDGSQASAKPTDWGDLLREAFASGPIVLLVGSLVIGYLTGPTGWKSLEPVLGEPFKGILVLFLLDMGTVAASSLKRLPESSLFLVGFAVFAAIFHAGLGLLAGTVLHLPPGDVLLVMILLGSASYIAVPAAARLALPQANAGIYLPMSLGVTFPFNVAIGIPIYLTIVRMVVGG